MNRCLILRLFEQDVQISGTKTGSLVSATLRNYAAVRVSAGYDIGVSFFLGYFIFWTSKKEVPHRSGRNLYCDKGKILRIKNSAF